jgi:hypothetical protein
MEARTDTETHDKMTHKAAYELDGYNPGIIEMTISIICVPFVLLALIINYIKYGD